MAAIYICMIYFAKLGKHHDTYMHFKSQHYKIDKKQSTNRYSDFNREYSWSKYDSTLHINKEMKQKYKTIKSRITSINTVLELLMRFAVVF